MTNYTTSLGARPSVCEGLVPRLLYHLRDASSCLHRELYEVVLSVNLFWFNVQFSYSLIRLQFSWFY